MKNAFVELSNTKFGKRYLGDRAFYMAVLGIVIPVVIQNSISNFVSLLDNLMVAAVSTNQMNGVSIANQLIFVFNLCIFGGVAGPGIFSAQFFGAGDRKGVRDSFRYAMVIAALVSVVAIVIFALFRTPIAATYINNPQSPEAAHEMLSVASDYLLIMMLGLVPFAVSQAYASILRSCGETRIPMFAAVISGHRFRNTVLNVFRTNGYICGPQTAMAYGGVQDYRAKTGENRSALLIAQYDPADDAGSIAEALGITEAQLREKMN
jgi:Na+-driven multidrug efflux pump